MIFEVFFLDSSIPWKILCCYIAVIAILYYYIRFSRAETIFMIVCTHNV